VINLVLLLGAIILEVCGDASIRIGLRGGKPIWFLAGAVLVICYGSVISFPNWSFSRTMGVYIAMFFLVSQVVSRVMLHESVRLPTIVGGVLIVSGGLVILLWRPA
jgi:drug/metabolite transporter superfamily protein YnfA